MSVEDNAAQDIDGTTAIPGGDVVSQDRTMIDQASDLFGDVDLDGDTPEEIKPQSNETATDTPPVGEEDEYSEDINGLSVKPEDEPFEGEIDGAKINLPKGVKPDNPEVKEFIKVFNEFKDKPEGVQKLFDMYMQKQSNIVGTLVQKDTEFRNKMDKTWREENLSHNEFGGSNYEASTNLVTSVLRKFCPKDEYLSTMEKDGKMGMREFLHATRMNNFPPLRNMLVRVGKYIQSAQPVTTNASDMRGTPKEFNHKDALFAEI